MKNPTFAPSTLARLLFNAAPLRRRRPRPLAACCSAAVLAGLGLVLTAPPSAAQGAGGVLPVNTLPVVRGVVAGQAIVRAPMLTGSTSQLTIDQASLRAVIDWRSFNIGRSAGVMFNHQQGSNSISLNRVYDADPSVIEGRLASQGPVGADGKPTAGGQLILINQNGILFNRGAQVNTQSLIASTLNLRISNLDFCGNDTAACNSGAPLTTGGLLAPAFEGGYDDAGNWLPVRPGAFRPGDIGIGSFGPADAELPLLQAGTGGSMVFIAARVDNESGIIRAPDGQVILAAGNKAYLSLDEGDNALRGFRVEVEANKDGPGVNLSNLVRNAGEISADRGNVSIAALAINQDGRVSAKTAVQRNGTIYLKARTKDNADAGTLTLGKASVTEVMPDSADTATLPDSSPYAAVASDFRGVIRAQAGLIESHGTLQAAGGRIGLEATDSSADTKTARVYLAAGSVTSVAGAWADVAAEKYLKTIRVTSNELKNAPDQKTGILLGATVAVDLRDGSNILALDGYRGAIERTVTEKAAVGGEMAIGSTGSVILRSGATLDASGGGYRHAGARVVTSKLRAENGSIHDISSAPQQQRYVAQLDRYQKTDERWGQRSDIVNLAGGAWRPGYVEGLAGGTIRIGSAAGLVLDGTLKGGVTVGPRQMAAAPKAATLLVGTGLAALALNRPPAPPTFNGEGQRIGNVTWQQRTADSLGSGFNAASALTATQRDNVRLAAEQIFGVAKVNADGRVETGFGNVEVNSDGRIVVSADVSIRSESSASLRFRAPAVDIAGDIRLPAGTLTIDPPPMQQFGVDPITPDLATLVERTTVRGTATLSVAGDWLNYSGNGGTAVGSALLSGRRTNDSGGVKSATEGGRIVLLSTGVDNLSPTEYQTRLERGAVLDVSGGAAINSAKVISGGAGGELILSYGGINQASPDWMQAELRGHALAQGGKLTLNLNRAVIDDPAANGTLPASTTRLSTDFFTQQGFEKLTVNAGSGIEVAEGKVLKLQQRNFAVDGQAALALASGGDLRSAATVELRPDHQRRAAELTLAGGSKGVGSLTVGRDAVLATDAGGKLSLSGGAGLSVLGSLLAPGGSIALKVDGLKDQLAAPLHLGRNAVVSAAGTFVATPNDAGQVRGTVYGGGTVTLEATQAAVVADAGSRIDVSGVEKMLTVANSANASTGAPLQQAVAGHAGTLIVKAQRGASLNGSLAAAGPGSAAGGSFALEISSGDNQVLLPPPQRLVVSADGHDAAPAAGTVTSTININALQSAGFQKLRLQSQDRIEFQGQTTLDFERGIRLDAPEIVLATAARSNLRAATVSLGQSWGPRTFGDSDTPSVKAWNRDNTLQQPERSVVAGNGVLSIDAGNVDFFGSLTLQGTALTSVRTSGDVRFIGREVNVAGAGGALQYTQLGSLDAAGALEFRAAQLYPSTRTSFEVQTHGADNYTLVAPAAGATAGDVYSAAGSLTLKADTIVQQGTLRAPLGELSLQAAQRLELAPGSVTSVSGSGTTVLYGTTVDGLVWRYAEGANTTSLSGLQLDAVSKNGKRLTLSAPTVQVAAGATVDLRGGGNVLAVEFVPGNGGDTDLAAAADTYAIIPKSRLAGIPYDSFLQQLGGRDPGAGFLVNNPRDAALYDSVQIEAGGHVPAGDYVLLPTRFAQLPDAFLVQLQTGSAWRNLQPGQTGQLGNGQTVVAGHRSARGTSVRESQSVGVVVLPGSAVSRFSDYTVSDARLFADNAERAGSVLATSPWDAGLMQFRDTSTLSLAGSFLTAGSELAGRSGRTAEVDIAGRLIAVVEQVGAVPLPAGTLQISSASLSRLNASVVLGGTRQRGSDGVLTLTTQAEQIDVANTAQQPVTLPELVLTAKKRIDIAAGSVLRAEGDASGAATALRAESSGTLLRLSAGAQATLDRGNASAAAGDGDLNIAAGAQLSAAGSLLLDATHSTTSAASLRAGGADGSGGAISLSASRVSVGQTQAAAPGTLGGLVLSEADLTGYAKLDELTLRAYERIDLFGDTTLGSAQLQRLTLDTPLLAAVPVAGVARAGINAATVELLNRSAVRSESAGGTGTLNVSATRLLIGQGDKASSGFGNVVLAGSSSIDTQGQGSLRSGGELTLNTPALRALALADQQIAAVDSSVAGAPTHRTLRLNATATTAAGAAETPALGGRIALQGGAVAIDGTVRAHSGRIAVVAQGGDLTLGSRGVLDAAGQTRDFNGSVVAADGGSVALSADTGRVQLAAGSRVDVASAAGGGNAGSLELRAREATLQGSIAGQAAAGARGGAAQIDLDQLGGAAAFASLNALLNSGGFNEQRTLRLRSGDLAVAAGHSVDARRVSLVSDQGRIEVFGSVGRNSEGGGARIDLSAAQGLTLAAGSQLLAAGSGVAARGGEVRVQTRAGTLAFDRDATIDVRAGSAGPQGSVLFSVARDAADNIGATQLQGQVLRAGGNARASVDLEATRVYSGAEVPATIAAPQIAAWGSDHQRFVAASAGSTLLAGLRDDSRLAIADARLLGATEIQAAGDLAISANWNLTDTTSWRASELPGTLTIRTPGTLTLSQTLGAPGLPTGGSNATTHNANNNVNHAIVAGDTWNIRLAAGADLTSADGMATRGPAASAGHLLLTGANANIRTGTGRVELAAAGDIRLDHQTSAIYTGGRIGAQDTAVNGNNRWAVDGGNISLRAGGSVQGAADARDQWVGDWLRRWRETPTNFANNGYRTDWWSYRPRFQQGVGTLAGGDIDVRAGGNVSDLMFALPTSGMTVNAGGTRSVEVTGGGDLAMHAGGDVDGTPVLIGRGRASVEAGGNIGQRQALQGYLMGFSRGAVPEQAELQLSAGGSATLQSVDNPTYLALPRSTTGAAGPSFGPRPTSEGPRDSVTFFTYAANSAAGVISKGGDVGVLGKMAPSDTLRYIASATNQNGTLSPDFDLADGWGTAFPARLSLVSLSGDVAGSGSFGRLAAVPNRIATYPSPLASLVVLAQESIREPAIEVSDLSPAALIAPLGNFEKALIQQAGSGVLNNFDAGGQVSTRLSKPVSLGRIVQRDGSLLPFGLVGRDTALGKLSIDVQALNGDIVSDTDSLLYLTARSRVRAGQNIINPRLQLQNLADGDVSEVRAVQGDIVRRGGSYGIEIQGPGRLLVQSGGDIDLGGSEVTVVSASAGGLVATGNNRNPLLPANSARLTVVAGVSKDLDLSNLDPSYTRLRALNEMSTRIASLYAQLELEEGDGGRAAVLGAANIAALTGRNPAYARFADLDTAAPEALAAYQAVLREGRLPLGGGADAAATQRLLGLLNQEDDVVRMANATSLRAYLAGLGGSGGVTVGGEMLDAATVATFSSLGDRFPSLFKGAVVRRQNGARLTGTAPLVFDEALAGVVGGFIPATTEGGGSILSYLTSIQTQGGSDIDLWAPKGNILVGLTTANNDRTVGVLTNQGGAVRGVLSGDISINQGKVITAQGGDILLYSAQGSIDAGRGAKTSLSTPPPQRRPILDSAGNQIGFELVIPASATGSGIQTLTSDPDGLGPGIAPKAGDIYLFAPAGKIDAGEAGIRSSGNILINAQVVLNAADIRAAGSAQGVPQVPTGSVASALAAGGSNTTGGSQAAEQAAKSAEQAARRAASAPPPPRPTILTVEVMGFGERNCKEDDKECFAK